MKRKGNIYQKICSIDNLRIAEKKARKGKRKQPGIIDFDRNSETNFLLLNEILINKSYKTSEYKIFPVYEPKEREVYRLPYFPDRITHHAIMNVLEPIFMATFTADTYSCIKGKGIHGASFALRESLKDKANTTYCLKLDIKKFYPNIDHDILKALLRRKIKDTDLLWLLDEIIDSAPGLPIGNYLSQYFANFYLTYFDHWLKENKGVKHYFRYCDDLVILSSNKAELHQLLSDIRTYLNDKLALTIKNNYRVFPVESCGIDFVGYVHYHDCVYLRKSIKQDFARAAKNGNRASVASYYGWAKHSNSKHLLKKLLMTRFSDLGITPPSKAMSGEKIKISKVLNKEISVLDYKIKPSKYLDKGNGKCLYIQAEIDGAKRIIFTGSGVLMDTLELIPKDKFPITTTIIEEDESFQFS